MYSYKINNSYTIYVNYEYLNECKKASDRDRELRCGNTTFKRKDESKKWIHPYKENTLVYHKVFGYGKVSEEKEAGYISIIFGDVVRKFLYPQAFVMGYLARN